MNEYERYKNRALAAEAEVKVLNKEVDSLKSRINKLCPFDGQKATEAWHKLQALISKLNKEEYVNRSNLSQ